jgi:carbamoyl-phosphate synthase large subunit
MLGATIAQLREIGMLPTLGDGGELPPNSPVCVKEAVLPFARFLGIDTILGPEMRSTGEVMGIDRTFGVAFAKAQAGAMSALPTSGTVFISVANRDKRSMIFPVKRLHDLGFEIVATEGTAEILRRNGVPSRILRKLSDGTGPNGEPTTVDAILAGDVDAVAEMGTDFLETEASEVALLPGVARSAAVGQPEEGGGEVGDVLEHRARRDGAAARCAH